MVGILSDQLQNGAVNGVVILPRDIVFRMRLGEVLFDLAQPVGAR